MEDETTEYVAPVKICDSVTEQNFAITKLLRIRKQQAEWVKRKRERIRNEKKQNRSAF